MQLEKLAMAFAIRMASRPEPVTDWDWATELGNQIAETIVSNPQSAGIEIIDRINQTYDDFDLVPFNGYDFRAALANLKNPLSHPDVYQQDTITPSRAKEIADTWKVQGWNAIVDCPELSG